MQITLTITLADLALIVFDKCITLHEEEIHGTLVTTSMVYNYEFIDDFDYPTLGKFGKFLLKKVLPTRSKPHDSSVVVKNDPAISENGDLELGSLSHLNGERRDTLDSRRDTLNSQTDTLDSRTDTLDSEQRIGFNQRRTTLASELQSCCGPALTESWGPKDFDKDHHTMALMVKVKQMYFNVYS